MAQIVLIISYGFGEFWSWAVIAWMRPGQTVSPCLYSCFMEPKEHVEIASVDKEGRIELSQKALGALGVAPGKEVKIKVRGKQVTVERHIADPFAEYRNKPKAPGIQGLATAQKKKKEEAKEEFKKRLKERPEVRPEDRPYFWD